MDPCGIEPLTNRARVSRRQEHVSPKRSWGDLNPPALTFAGLRSIRAELQDQYITSNATERNRTVNLLADNERLCQLSYGGKNITVTLSRDKQI